MTTGLLASTAIEVMKSYGARTPERLDSLVEFYAASNYGPAPWREDIADMVARAKVEARQRVPQWMWQ